MSKTYYGTKAKIYINGELVGTFRDCRFALSSVDIDLPRTSSADLDELANRWGLIRNENEQDDALRHRIRSLAADDGILPVGMSIEGFSISMKKCECGAASLGHTQPGQAHSSWCPLKG